MIQKRKEEKKNLKQGWEVIKNIKKKALLMSKWDKQPMKVVDHIVNGKIDNNLDNELEDGKNEYEKSWGSHARVSKSEGGKFNLRSTNIDLIRSKSMK